MSLLSEEAVAELSNQILPVLLERFDEAVEARAEPYRLMQQKEFIEKFGLSTTSLKEWEVRGLKRMQFTGARSVWYSPKQFYEVWLKNAI